MMIVVFGLGKIFRYVEIKIKIFKNIFLFIKHYYNKIDITFHIPTYFYLIIMTNSVTRTLLCIIFMWPKVANQGH